MCQARSQEPRLKLPIPREVSVVCLSADDSSCTKLFRHPEGSAAGDPPITLGMTAFMRGHIKCWPPSRIMLSPVIMD